MYNTQNKYIWVLFTALYYSNMTAQTFLVHFQMLLQLPWKVKT